MKWNPLTRRMFLQGAGNLTFSIPLLQSLLPRELWAAEASVIRRYIAIPNDMGYGPHYNWYPTKAAPTGSYTVGGESFKAQRLKDFAPNASSNFSPIFQNLINPHLQHINFYRGLDWSTRYGHCRGAMLGVYRTDSPGHNSYLDAIPLIRTVDQALNDSTKFNPGKRPIALIGIKGHGGKNAHSFGRNSTGRIEPKDPIDSPATAFKTFFPRAIIPSGGPQAGTTNPHVDLLSLVHEDYQRTIASKNISKGDKTALENMADNFSDLQNSLKNPVSYNAQCDTRDVDDPGSSADNMLGAFNVNSGLSNSELIALEQKMMKQFVDILFMAMVCDVVRVGVLSHGVGGYRFDLFAKLMGLSGTNYHDGVTHRQSATINGRLGKDRVADYMRYGVTGYLVPLIEKMQSFVDPANGKTMLYNSLIHVGNEHSTNHSGNCLPVMTVGHAAGAVKTGYLIEYMDRSKPFFTEMIEGPYSDNPSSPEFINAWPGLHYNRVFATIFHAMGLGVNDFPHEAPQGSLATVNGYGYLNATTYGSGPYLYFRKTWNDEKNAKYDIQKSGAPIPMPSVDAPV